VSLKLLPSVIIEDNIIIIDSSLLKHMDLMKRNKNPIHQPKNKQETWFWMMSRYLHSKRRRSNCRIDLLRNNLPLNYQKMNRKRNWMKKLMSLPSKQFNKVTLRKWRNCKIRWKLTLWMEKKVRLIKKSMKNSRNWRNNMRLLIWKNYKKQKSLKLMKKSKI